MTDPPNSLTYPDQYSCMLDRKGFMVVTIQKDIEYHITRIKFKFELTNPSIITHTGLKVNLYKGYSQNIISRSTLPLDTFKMKPRILNGDQITAKIAWGIDLNEETPKPFTIYQTPNSCLELKYIYEAELTTRRRVLMTDAFNRRAKCLVLNDLTVTIDIDSTGVLDQPATGPKLDLVSEGSTFHFTLLGNAAKLIIFYGSSFD